MHEVSIPKLYMHGPYTWMTIIRTYPDTLFCHIFVFAASSCL